MSRVKHLEASQKEQEALAEHESQLMRIIELFMQDDVRACTVMDYVVVFFRLVLAKLRQRGQDFDDVKQLNKALSDEEVAQIFRTVLSKLGFPAAEQQAIGVVLEAMQHRKWPQSQVMTTSPGGDAQISSALLYLRLQRDLDPVMSSALQRALCAAHECILTDMAIFEAIGQDVNINASDVRKDDAYVDARVKYEDYVSFDRGQLNEEEASVRNLVREDIADNVAYLDDGAVIKISSEDSDPMEKPHNQRERHASSSHSVESGSSVKDSFPVDNSFSVDNSFPVDNSFYVQENVSVKQSQDTFQSCSTSTEINQQRENVTANVQKVVIHIHQEISKCTPAPEVVDIDSVEMCNDLEKPARKYQDISYNACAQETEMTAKISPDKAEPSGMEEGCQSIFHFAGTNDNGMAARAGNSVEDDKNPALNMNQSPATVDSSPLHSADESESPILIDQARLAPDPNLYVICYDVASPSSPNTSATEDVQMTTNQTAERRHKHRHYVPRGTNQTTSNVEY
ncbi:hypothetical protein ACOMHN_019022 [Nucella lapillus]